MKLSETITELRTKSSMSQGDIAEKLGVSRQSVSKWETGTSVPDIDKLVMLSEIYNISLDYLVKGEDYKRNNSDEGSSKQQIDLPDEIKRFILKTDRQSESKTRRIIAFMLLGAGVFSVILGLVFGVMLLYLGIYLISCGLISFYAGRYAKFIILWITFSLFIFIAPYVTGGVYPLAIFSPYLYVERYLIQLAIAFGIWLLFAVLLYFSLRITRLKKYYALILSWIVGFGMFPNILIGFLTRDAETLYIVAGTIALILLMINIFLTIRAIKKFKLSKQPSK